MSAAILLPPLFSPSESDPACLRDLQKLRGSLRSVGTVSQRWWRRVCARSAPLRNRAHVLAIAAGGKHTGCRSVVTGRARLPRCAGITPLTATAGIHPHRRLVSVGDVSRAHDNRAAVAALTSQAANPTVSARAAVSSVPPQFAIFPVSAFSTLAAILALAAFAALPTGAAFCREGYQNRKRIHFDIDRSAMRARPAGAALSSLHTRPAGSSDLGAIIINPIAIGVVSVDSSAGSIVKVKTLTSIWTRCTVCDDIRHNCISRLFWLPDRGNFACLIELCRSDKLRKPSD
ncbi:MAG: hypothetical protein ABFS45_23595 [Pseudomonadota bacterium]